MTQGTSSAALIAAALILGGSVVGASYLLAGAIDRGSGEVAALNVSLNSVIEVAKAAARPSAPAAAKRLDPKKVYKIEVGSAPIRGPKSAPITVVEWADFQ